MKVLEPVVEGLVEIDGAAKRGFSLGHSSFHFIKNLLEFGLNHRRSGIK